MAGWLHSSGPRLKHIKAQAQESKAGHLTVATEHIGKNQTEGNLSRHTLTPTPTVYTRQEAWCPSSHLLPIRPSKLRLSENQPHATCLVEYSQSYHSPEATLLNTALGTSPQHMGWGEHFIPEPQEATARAILIKSFKIEWETTQATNKRKRCITKIQIIAETKEPNLQSSDKTH